MIIIHFHLGECLPNSLFSPNSPFLSKSPVSKGIPLPSHLNFCSELWRMFAIFVIYAKLAIFVKIASLKGPLRYLISIFSWTLVLSKGTPLPSYSPFSAQSSLSKGPFVISFEFFPKLADVRNICHFRQNRHSQSGAFATS